MLIQLQNGEIIEIDDMVNMDYENWEKVREAYDAAIDEIKRLRRETRCWSMPRSPIQSSAETPRRQRN